jgi:phosphoribosylformylglycinamidine cyclo-ligase
MAKSYEARGVSANKPDVHFALAAVDQGLFPGAFCKVIPDVLIGDPNWCCLLHADGAGTKSALAYTYWRKSGDIKVFQGIAQDSIVMNLDDMLCVGASGPFLMSNTIGRNAKLIPAEALREIVDGYTSFCAQMSRFGVEIASCGGETADLGDLVRTIVIDSTLMTRVKRASIIDASRVQPGHDIVGLASFGRATYESVENSGIGTNGLTAARHELLSAGLKAEFPETFAPEIRDHAYLGQHDLDTPLPGTAMTIGEALLSPTRTYAPIVTQVLARANGQVSALFHNTGGGLTKCLKFGAGVRYIKDNLFPLPPIFRFIKDKTGMSLHDMAEIFNMGHRFEVVCSPRFTQEVIDLSHRFGVAAQVIGRVEKASNGASLVLSSDGKTAEFGRKG